MITTPYRLPLRTRFRGIDVRDGLLALAVQSGTKLLMNTVVTDISPDSTGGWLVHVGGGEALKFDAVVIATGGLSVPATGSDGAGLSWLAKLGHTINPTYAALTPLTEQPASFAELSGVSLKVTLTATSTARSATATGAPAC